MGNDLMTRIRGLLSNVGNTAMAAVPFTNQYNQTVQRATNILQPVASNINNAVRTNIPFTPQNNQSLLRLHEVMNPVKNFYSQSNQQRGQQVDEFVDKLAPPPTFNQPWTYGNAITNPMAKIVGNTLFSNQIKFNDFPNKPYSQWTELEKRQSIDNSLNIAMGISGGMKNVGGEAGEILIKPTKQAATKILNKVNSKGLLNETLAQTAFRRSAGLTPEMTYTKPKAQFAREATTTPPSNVVGNVDILKDIGETSKGFKDVYRNFQSVFKDQFPKIKAAILDPFDAAKGSNVDTINKWSGQLDNVVIKKMGIKPGSKESAAVQMFGEGKMQIDEIEKKFGTQMTNQIIEADHFFRSAYDTLLDQVNAGRKAIYPNAPEMWIPKRKDYYRHFKELSGIEGLKNIFENPAGIDPNLVGASDFTTPRSKWLSFAQKRTGDETNYDAVGGFLEYLPKASFAMHIDPHIAKFRALQSELVQKTSQGTGDYRKLNNFIEFLEDYANDLSGKTNPLDRGIQKYIPGGRRTFRVLDWVNKRVKANTILGSLSSSVAQIFNVPQGIASAGEKNFLAGTLDTVLNPLKPTDFFSESAFIKERYFKGLDKFDTGILKYPKQFAGWMTGVLDEFGTKSIWAAHYKKALSQGIANPTKYADDVTRSLVAGRGIGEVPLVQKSKLFQLVAPFQLEVSNLWQVMGEMVGKKAFGQLAKLFVYNYLFNSVSEQLIGRRVTFDPIDAMVDAFSDEDKTLLTRGGRLAGEVLSNLPLGQTVASVYPEYGTEILGQKLPTREKLFGEADPTRFGSGLFAAQALKDPLYKLLPPFGGGQLKKTIEGLQTVNRGHGESPTGRVQFPVSQTPLRYLQAGAFGKYAVPEAREYFAKGRTPLGDKQSELVKSQDNAEALKTYQTIMEKRQDSAKLDQVKDMVANTGVNSYYGDTFAYYDTRSGTVKTVDVAFQPQAPTLTGQPELDKKLISKYRGEITSKENDILELFSQKAITATEAEKGLAELDGLRAKLLKPRKLAGIKGLKTTKVKMIKLAKSKPFKVVGLKKAPKLKSFKAKNILTKKATTLATLSTKFNHSIFPRLA